MCKFHEEGPMGGNWTVWYFCMNKFPPPGQVESSGVVRLYYVRNIWRPVSLTLSVLMQWIHEDMDFSDWPQMVRCMCVCLRKDVNCGRCWVLTEYKIYLCRLILGMLCMMGGRYVFVVVMFMTDNIWQRTIDFCDHRCIREVLYKKWKHTLFPLLNRI